MSNSDDHDGYKVGKGRPPKEHQFAKGTSGNPNGRPPKNKDEPLRRSFNPFVDAVLAATERPVPVREGGKESEMTVFEAALRQLGNRAARGDPRATAKLIELRASAQKERDEEMLDMLRIVEEYKAEWEPKFRSAQAQGLPKPDQFPHPDHVTFCYETGLLQLTGPDTPELGRWWAGLKRDLSISERTIETFRASLASAEHPAEDKRTLRKLQAYHRELLALVPTAWDWREQI